MKKAILLSLVLLGAVACGGERKTAQTTPETSEEPATTTVTADTTAAAKEAPICGGYSTPRPLKDAEKALFATATADLKGVIYTPQLVATQVVAGMNYRFYCTARPTTADAHSYDAEIVIFEPLPVKHEQPRVTSITEVKEAK